VDLTEPYLLLSLCLGGACVALLLTLVWTLHRYAREEPAGRRAPRTLTLHLSIVDGPPGLKGRVYATLLRLADARYYPVGWDPEGDLLLDWAETAGDAHVHLRLFVEREGVVVS
jgi:hypothetical protein